MQHRRVPPKKVGNSRSLTLNFGFDANSRAVYLPIPLEQPVISTMVVILASQWHTDNLPTTLDVLKRNAQSDGVDQMWEVKPRSLDFDDLDLFLVSCSAPTLEEHVETQREQNHKSSVLSLHFVESASRQNAEPTDYRYLIENLWSDPISDSGGPILGPFFVQGGIKGEGTASGSGLTQPIPHNSLT